MQEFARLQPKEGWFRITGATTDATEAIYIQDNPNHFPDTGDGSGVIRKILVPAHTLSPDLDDPAKVVLVTEQLRIRKVVNELYKLGQSEPAVPSKDENGDEADSDQNHPPKASDAVIEKWVIKNANRIIETRTVEGMVRSADNLELDDAKLYQLIRKNLSPRHVILEEGLTPKTDADGSGEIVLGVLFGGVGAIFIVVVGYVFFKTRQTGIIPGRTPPPPISESSHFHSRKRSMEE